MSIFVKSVNRKYFISVFLAVLSATSVLFFFQQCSNVKLVQYIVQASDNKMSGIFCHPQPKEYVSEYTLSDFYVINMTGKKYQGLLKPDSNTNGTIDQLEGDEIAPTLKISALDVDMDGIPDFLEKLKGLNPTRDDANEDGPDLDGITNKRELQLGTDPAYSHDESALGFTAELTNDTSECGQGQPAYSFHLNKLAYVQVDKSIDQVNAMTYSLSHEENENLILILARMSPANSNNEDIFLAHIFRGNISVPLSLSLVPSDFFILSDISDACPGCQAGYSGTRYAQITAGVRHSCALSDQGQAYCWGNNTNGELGNGTTQQHFTPVRVDHSEPLSFISAGKDHTCALSQVGNIFCWGDNTYGQLGSGDTHDSTLPLKVTLGAAALKVSTGYHHSCAYLADNSIRCWGKNLNGQLGDGTTTNSTSPKLVSLSTSPQSPLKSLSSGKSHNCIVDNLGRFFCWGSGPQSPAGGFEQTHAWKSVVTNGVVNYGIDANLVLPGRIVCWGASGSMYKSYYSDGCGLMDETQGSTDEFTQGISRVKNIALGTFQSCAIYEKLNSDTTLSAFLDCWNSSDPTPTTISDISAPVDVSASDQHFCAIDKDGLIWCWGSNNYGQLGSGNIMSESTPKKVVNQ